MIVDSSSALAVAMFPSSSRSGTRPVLASSMIAADLLLVDLLERSGESAGSSMVVGTLDVARAHSVRQRRPSRHHAV